MILLQDVWSAIDKGYEQIAMMQFFIARREPITGDVTIFNKPQIVSSELLAYLETLEELSIGHTMAENAIIERLYNNIKFLTTKLE